MKAKILIVDDQKDLLELLSMALEQEGYTVRTAASGAEAIQSVLNDKPDLILLDILLGDTSGIKLTAKWKNDIQTSHIPIILLTAKDSETDIVVGLNVGADDYITKPFSTPVLLARIDAVLRRSSLPSPAAIADIIAAGPVKIAISSQHVTVDGKPVDLTAAEFKILLALVKAAGQIVSRKDLLSLIPAGAGDTSNLRVVDVHIAALRKKLGHARAMIKTVHGKGYRAVF